MSLTQELLANAASPTVPRMSTRLPFQYMLEQCLQDNFEVLNAYTARLMTPTSSTRSWAEEDALEYTYQFCASAPKASRCRDREAGPPGRSPIDDIDRSFVEDTPRIRAVFDVLSTYMGWYALCRLVLSLIRNAEHRADEEIALPASQYLPGDFHGNLFKALDAQFWHPFEHLDVKRQILVRNELVSTRVGLEKEKARVRLYINCLHKKILLIWGHPQDTLRILNKVARAVVDQLYIEMLWVGVDRFFASRVFPFMRGPRDTDEVVPCVRPYRFELWRTARFQEVEVELYLQWASHSSSPFFHSVRNIVNSVESGAGEDEEMHDPEPSVHDDSTEEDAALLPSTGQLTQGEQDDDDPFELRTMTREEVAAFTAPISLTQEENDDPFELKTMTAEEVALFTGPILEDF
ncbi:hypothetical protein BDZ89DRAFT_1232027 [Hymenopellis radicata]|nr:hypothetical protein BDZ89DRAFT_1232027 [Hymenopellis radicata]